MSDRATLPELAERLGVPASTARGWRRRYEDFPVPVLTVGDRALYDAAEVEAWYARHDPSPGRRAS